MSITTNPSWLAADYRAALEAWRATAPDTDSEIFGRPRQSAPRHAEKARRYRDMLTFRSPPTGEPIASNWRTLPDNDNAAPADFTSERRIETVPSEAEIVASIEDFDETVKFSVRREARLAGGKFTRVPRGTLHWPVDGDFELGTDCDGNNVIARLVDTISVMASTPRRPIASVQTVASRHTRLAFLPAPCGTQRKSRLL